MNGKQADRVDDIHKNGKKEFCGHQRMVDEQYNDQGKKTGRLVCRECGAVLHDSMKA